MSESKKLSIGTEMTDDELMEMTGGSSFYIPCQKNYTFSPNIPYVKYGIPTVKYGIPMAKYGIKPMSDNNESIAMPLYGILPF